MRKGEMPVDESKFADLPEQETERKIKVDGTRQEKTNKERRKKDKSGDYDADLELAKQKLKKEQAKKIAENKKKLAKKKASGYKGGKGLQDMEKAKAVSDTKDGFTVEHTENNAVHTAKESVASGVNIASEAPEKKKLVIARGRDTELAEDEKDVITDEDLEELDKESKRRQFEAERQKKPVEEEIKVSTAGEAVVGNNEDDSKQEKEGNSILLKENAEKNKGGQLTPEKSFENYEEDERLKKFQTREPAPEEKEKLDELLKGDFKKEEPAKNIHEEIFENVPSSTKEEWRDRAIDKEAERLEIEKDIRIIELEKKLAETEARLEEEIEKNTTLQEKKGIAAFLKKNKKNILILSGLIGASAATGGLAGAGFALGSAGIGELVRRKIERDEKNKVLSDEEEKKIIDEAKTVNIKSENDESAPGFFKKITKRLAWVFSGKKNSQQQKPQEMPENIASQNIESVVKKHIEIINEFKEGFREGEISGEVIYETADMFKYWVENELAGKGDAQTAVWKKIYDIDPAIQAKMVSLMLEYAIANNKDSKVTLEKVKYLTMKNNLDDIPGISEEAKKWLTGEEGEAAAGKKENQNKKNDDGVEVIEVLEPKIESKPPPHLRIEPKEKTDAKDSSMEEIINELHTNKFRAGEKINNFLRKGEKRNDAKEFDRVNLLKFITILNEEIKNTKDIDSLSSIFEVASDALQYGRIDKDSGNHAATFNSIFSDTRKITGEKLKTLIEKDKLPDDRIREVVKRMFWFKGDYVLDKNNKVNDILNELAQDKWFIKKNK